MLPQDRRAFGFRWVGRQHNFHVDVPDRFRDFVFGASLVQQFTQRIAPEAGFMQDAKGVFAFIPRFASGAFLDDV